MDVVKIYTDGSAKGNPGPAGWAYLLRWRDQEKQASGYLGHSTNNRAELTAVIEALQALKRPVGRIEIYSDSEYVVKGINKWLKEWQARNFANVKNPDLWKTLATLLKNKATEYEAFHIRAHQGHKENEYVDKMAQTAANNGGSD